jgi:hypothetical protein
MRVLRQWVTAPQARAIQWICSSARAKAQMRTQCPVMVFETHSTLELPRVEGKAVKVRDLDTRKFNENN